MTAIKQANEKYRLFSRKNICTFLIFILGIMLFVHPDVVTKSMRRGLELCVRTIIPSIFPFMVLSGLITKSEMETEICRLLGKPIGSLFGISTRCTCPLILGFVCGFPIGTATAVELYRNNEISHAELERVMLFCNQTGPAFLITAVGSTLWASQAWGICLVCIQFLSAVLLSLFLPGRTKEADVHHVRCKSPTPLASIFTQSISSSATGMLLICAYIVFFSVVIGLVNVFIMSANDSALIKTLLCGALELSSGVSSAAALPNPQVGAVMTGFIVGWSGLSVHFQVMAMAADVHLNFRRYLVIKFLQASICTALVYFSLPLTSRLIASPSRPVGTFRIFPPRVCNVLLLFFLFGLILTFWKFFKKNLRNRTESMEIGR